MSIRLNLINNSNLDYPNVVIFQKNQATVSDGFAIAWHVISYLGQGDNHPFAFPLNTLYISASDSWGNFTPQLKANAGDFFHVAQTPSGDNLMRAGAASSPTEVQLRNDLPQGAINANVYKNGRLLAIKTGIAPGQKAAFSFKPTMWIGVVSQVEEGEVMNSATLSNINTQISLTGISSADIVMTGGGTGPSSTPYKFSLENVKMA